MHRPIRINNRPPDAPPRTIMLLMAHPVDADAFGLWCRDHVDCDVIETAAELDQGFARCRKYWPILMVLDPAAAGDALERALAALLDNAASHLLVLDDRPHEIRLAQILSNSSASYFTRAAGSQALAAAFEEILAHGRRVFDPALASRIRHTGRGFQLDGLPETRSIALLSPREREVMRLLAGGRSVRQCAQTLGLSESTIDNHKSRLMKKLALHKSSELTCQAIREGLIMP